MENDIGQPIPVNRNWEDAELLAAFDAGIREGVRGALLEHKRAGRSIIIWSDGKMVELPAERIPEE